MKVHKEMNNVEIKDLLEAVAASYQLKGGQKNRFKVIAYQRAAVAIEHLSSEAKDLWDEGRLEDVAGIGKSIASHLGEIFLSGKSEHFQKVMKGLPPAMFELMKVSGIGAKTAFRLTQELKISDKKPLKELEKLAKEGKLAKLEGFGEDSEKSILESLKEIKGKEIRLLLPYAEELANEVVEWMKRNGNVQKVQALGSLRRKASTVGDVDIAVASSNPKKVIEHFCSYPNAKRVLEKGDRTASIILPGNKQVDLMVEKPDAFGALLQHFTGSKHHNIALRKIGQKRGISISDYGIWVKRGGKKKLVKLKTEEEFYKYLKMEYIPPELREDRGEIEVAQKGVIPNLIEFSDVKADLQIHSSFDIETSHDLGLSTMEEIVEKADKLGYQYIALTEHNPSKSHHTAEQIVKLLEKKKEKVKIINEGLKERKQGSMRKVFNSLEIDMLPNGDLPVPDKGMQLLDFALVSIHSSFKQTKAEMTKRVLSGLSHPKVKIFAHPTGRKLNVREGVEIDWEAIFEYCKENKKWLEINAEPTRLDLPDFLVQDAIKHGIKLTLGTDAHHLDGMDNMKYGVSVARRGWATKNDIINTKNLEEFDKLLES